MRLGAAGLELGGSIFVGVLVGFWLDKKYGTAPWLALIGLLLGSAIGFRALFWILRHKSDTPGSSSPSARNPSTDDSTPHD
jgi:F0F1-type ATP synthase assembly protein I